MTLGCASGLWGSYANYLGDSYSTSISTTIKDNWSNSVTNDIYNEYKNKPIEEKEMKKKEDKDRITIRGNKVIFDGENIEMTPEFAEAFEKAYKEAKKKKKEKVIPRPNDPIKNVLFNIVEGITTVVWKDGTVTMVTCDPCDAFDEEKAIALCFMKKFFDNRGCYNDFMEKYLVHADFIE